jgi:light-dependent protochlorophyllide reductase
MRFFIEDSPLSLDQKYGKMWCDNFSCRGEAMQTVIITGGNTGLGYQCAREIAAGGDWQVIIACRNKEKADEAARQLTAETSHQGIEAMTLDLASLDSVRRFAQEFDTRELPPLKGIICNAGIQPTKRTSTQDGFEGTFAVNHLGHFLLINLLLRHIVPPGRIVFVSSGTHDPAQVTGMPKPRYENAELLAWPHEDQHALKESPAKAARRAYTTSKLCNVLCAYELSRRLQAHGYSAGQNSITVNAFDPGLMPGTGLARDYSAGERIIWNFILPVLRFFIPNVNTSQQSGQALARLLLDQKLEDVSGKYFEGLRPIPSSQESYDLEKAGELWRTSIRLTNLPSAESFLPI